MNIFIPVTIFFNNEYNFLKKRSAYKMKKKNDVDHIVRINCIKYKEMSLE